jgi:hypothetical protein
MAITSDPHASGAFSKGLGDASMSANGGSPAPTAPQCPAAQPEPLTAFDYPRRLKVLTRSCPTERGSNLDFSVGLAQPHPCPQLGTVRICLVGFGKYFGLEVGRHQASSNRLF